MRQVFDDWRRRSPWLAWLTLAHLALFLVLLLLAAVDGAAGDVAPIMGIGRWVKPMKFSLSLAFYLGALAWFAPAIGDARVRRWPLAIIGATMVVEIVAIVLQAARGTRSHFNAATPFDAGVFSLMGSAITLNTIALAWAGWLTFRGWRRESTGYRLGITLGIALALASSAIGGRMIAAQGHTVGAPDGGAGLPFVNWSTSAGDLRIAHFIGLHALQVLPLVGYRFGNRAVMLAAFAWVVVTAVTLAQAFAGRPLFAL